MIKNVNLLQNSTDFSWDENSKYTEEYLIQALANLGQRIGIKGDGIVYKSFTFNDVLDGTYSAEDSIGFIEYFKDDISNEIKAKFGVTEKLNPINSNKEVVFDASISNNDAYVFQNDLVFSIPVAGIEKYSKNSICINSNNELTFMLAGKAFSKDENDDNSAILLYYKFDTHTNRMLYCARLQHIKTSANGHNLYSLTRLVNNTKDNIVTNEYHASISVFDSSSLKNDNIDYTSLFENNFKYSNYEVSSNIPFSIIRKEYSDIAILEEYNDSAFNNFDYNSLVALILHSPTNLHGHKEVDLVFDSQKNELLAIGSEKEYHTLVEYFLDEYDFNLDEELFIVNDEINKLYVNIFRFYNEKFYLDYMSTFIKRILFKIYETASNHNYDNAYRMYIPLNYIFHYICNSNNDLAIYYSNNIYVTYTSLKNVDLESFWEDNTNIVYDYVGIDKVKTYNFEVSYNNVYTDIINSVDIKTVYTMPYINANNNWSINDIDTKICAVGKDANKPNIIIVLSKDRDDVSNSYELMSSFANLEEIKECKFIKKDFEINTALFENINDNKVKCCAYIPEVTNEYYEYFKDSLIFSISTLDCLDKYPKAYKGTYIYTLWRLTEVAGKFEFTLIKSPSDDFALTLGSTVNILSATADDQGANLDAMDILLYTAVVKTLAQERLGISSKNWGIIKNAQAEEYASEYGFSINEYLNDLNTILRYSDNVNVIGEHIIYEQNQKYISEIDKINVTDCLYPQYQLISKEIEVDKETIEKVVQEIQAIPIRNSKIYVKGNLVTNVESLIEELRMVESLEKEQVKIVVNAQEAQRINSNYREYTFNDNIPSIDLKEMFIRNFNLLNRMNLISLDKDGRMYNAYIGTSQDSDDKATLHIGTNQTNINVGSSTLMSEVDKRRFNTHDKISIDFDHIMLNGNSVITKSPVVEEYEVNGIGYKIGTTKMIGNFTRYGNGVYAISLNTVFTTLFGKPLTSMFEYGTVYIGDSNESATISGDNADYLHTIEKEIEVIELDSNVLYSPSEIVLMRYDFIKNSKNCVRLYISIK